MCVCVVLERKRDGNFMKDRKIYGENNVWGAAQRLKKIDVFDIEVGFELNHGSIG